MAKRAKARRGRRRNMLALNPACIWCGNSIMPKHLTTEHVIPLQDGGGNGSDNLALACWDCNKGRTMARKATVIGTRKDTFGDLWDLREVRVTKHGWPLWIGWPQGAVRGKGGVGGPRVIMTRSLGIYLSTTRLRDLELPITKTTITRLRRILGLHWRDDRKKWWEQKTDELLELSGHEFAEKYGLTESRVSQVHSAMFGRRTRPAGWWREGADADLLKGELARAYVAERLGISIGAVGRLRWRLRNNK